MDLKQSLLVEVAAPRPAAGETPSTGPTIRINIAKEGFSTLSGVATLLQLWQRRCVECSRRSQAAPGSANSCGAADPLRGGVPMSICSAAGLPPTTILVQRALHHVCARKWLTLACLITPQAPDHPMASYAAMPCAASRTSATTSAWDGGPSRTARRSRSHG